MDDQAPPAPFSLRSLSLPSRLTLAVFLLSVGVGYVSALVQLHFQHAGAGKLLPEPDDAVAVFHGKAGVSQMERLLVDSESKPFNGQGSMRAAFTTKSAGWEKALRKRAEKLNGDAVAAEKEIRAEREGEIQALVAYIKGGAKKDAWEKFPLEGDFKNPIAEKYLEVAEQGDKKVRFAKIENIVADRCTRCHTDGNAGPGQFPLDKWEDFKEYCGVASGSGMSLEKLAQSSHVHLLGFAVLYGFTGLLFSLTNYPWIIRFVLAPLPLLAQVVDISFWWLARLDPIFAHGIVVSGGIVALALLLQIVLTLFHLFGWIGRIAIVLLAAAVAGGVYLKVLPHVQTHLERNGIQIVPRAGG